MVVVKKRTSRKKPLEKNAVRTYFWHSRPELDIRGRDKRMTICCVIVDNTMRFGIAKGHTMDRKNWSKAEGRRLSEERAYKRPKLVAALPEKGVKARFNDVCKTLIVREIIKCPGGNMELAKEMLLKALNRKSATLDLLEQKLDRERAELVKRSTRVQSFFKEPTPVAA